MYADDLVILSENSSGLQTALNKLKTFCDKWHLTINLKKTKILIFNKGGHAIKEDQFYLDNIPIEKTNVYQYISNRNTYPIGINLSILGNFNCALRTIKEKALRVLFKLKQFNFRNNIKISLMLFNSLILPILKYCCEVWGPFLFPN